MNIRYEQRDGKTYAYTSTSKRVPGKKHPVSVKQYLGVVDPKTGEIISKNPQREPRNLPLDGVHILDYGNALIAFSLAERLGIREDLESVFDDRADMILALALAQAIKPTPSDSIDMVLNSSCIPQLLGLNRHIIKQEIRKTINSVDTQEMFSFFEKRWSRCNGKLYGYAHLLTNTNDDTSTSNNQEQSSVMTILMMMTEDGTPIGFHPVGDITRDTSPLIEILLKIKEMTGCIFIADIAISATLNLADFILNNVDFAIPYASSTDQYKAVQSEYRDVESPEYKREHQGNRYYLKEGKVGFLQRMESQLLLPESDPLYPNTTLQMRSFMCFDPRMRADAIDSMRESISDIRYRLNGRIFDDPDRAFRTTVGPLSTLFHYHIESNGSIKLMVRRHCLSEFNFDAGKTFVVVHSATWDDVVSGRIARSRMSRTITQFNGGSRSLRRYVSKGIRTDPHLFIEFIAIIIYSEMQRILDESEMNMDVNRVFLMASTYKAIVTDDNFIRGCRDRRLPRLFHLLGVDDDFKIT